MHSPVVKNTTIRFTINEKYPTPARDLMSMCWALKKIARTHVRAGPRKLAWENVFPFSINGERAPEIFFSTPGIGIQKYTYIFPRVCGALLHFCGAKTYFTSCRNPFFSAVFAPAPQRAVFADISRINKFVRLANEVYKAHTAFAIREIFKSYSPARYVSFSDWIGEFSWKFTCAFSGILAQQRMCFKDGQGIINCRVSCRNIWLGEKWPVHGPTSSCNSSRFNEKIRYK